MTTLVKSFQSHSIVSLPSLLLKYELYIKSTYSMMNFSFCICFILRISISCVSAPYINLHMQRWFVYMSVSQLKWKPSVLVYEIKVTWQVYYISVVTKVTPAGHLLWKFVAMELFSSCTLQSPIVTFIIITYVVCLVVFLSDCCTN